MKLDWLWLGLISIIIPIIVFVIMLIVDITDKRIADKSTWWGFPLTITIIVTSILIGTSSIAFLISVLLS